LANAFSSRLGQPEELVTECRLSPLTVRQCFSMLTFVILKLWKSATRLASAARPIKGARDVECRYSEGIEGRLSAFDRVYMLRA
jgi:hypothetical protein